MKNNQVIHVAVTINDRTGEYSRHLGALLASIFMNTDRKIFVHILHDYTLTETNKDNFLDLEARFNQKIKFYNIDGKVILENENKTLKKNTVGTLYRLLIPEIIYIDKIIYFDCDMICNLDIADIWEIDLENYAIAAVKDSDWYIKFGKKYKLYRKVNILDAKYFNAGMIIFNLNKIRQYYQLKKQCLDFLNKYTYAPCLDQDALNFIFRNDCKYLPNCYNQIADDIFDCDVEPCPISEEDWFGICWHFAGKEKPWVSKKYPVFKLYWAFLHHTAWADTPEKLFELMYQVKDGSLDRIMLSQDINSRKSFIKNFIKRLYNEILKFLKDK